MLQSLDRLKVFYHVFNRKSVNGAAKELHVSQPAVSQSLHKLESEIKTLLFTRLHKRLVPTAAGKRLFSVVKPFLGELDDCLKNLETSKEEPFGELRIGAPLEFGKKYLPGIMAEFRRIYPNVTFFLKLADLVTLLPLVEEGEIDFALIDVFLTQTAFTGNLDIYHFHPVMEEEVILACSDQYYRNNLKRDCSFENLASQDFISYRYHAQTIKNWFKHHFGRYTVNPRVVLTVDSLPAVISAIGHHAGMGVVASHMVDQEIESGRIVPITTGKASIINQISLANLQDKVPTLAEKIFQTFLFEQIQAMTASNDNILITH